MRVRKWVIDANEHVATKRETRMISASQNDVTNRNGDCIDETSFVPMMRYKVEKL
jgi:hypothetical protein